MKTIFAASYAIDRETFLKEDRDGDLVFHYYDSIEHAMAIEYENAISSLEDYYIKIVELGLNEKGEFTMPIKIIEITGRNI